MVRKSGSKPVNATKRDTLDDEVDALFNLPLPEFTAARNALASQLKKVGRSNDADYVKTLAKPSISAWAVNQLYWRHRQSFDRLIDSGGRFRQAQSSTGARKVADLRAALDARRESLSELSDLAADLVREAGHNATQEFSRRIATTLEAMSAYASQPDGPRPGRLTQDVDPPGFESLAAFVPSGSRQPAKESERKEQIKKDSAARESSKSRMTDKSSLRKIEVANEVRQRERDRQIAIAAAKSSTQAAKRILADVRTKIQRLEAAHKKAQTEARDAEKQSREAQALFVRAKAEAQDANETARNLADKVDEARHEVEEAKRAVERTAKELEKLFRSPNK